MSKLVQVLSIALALFFSSSVRADDGYDIFVPIAKYLEQGNAEKLSAWFSDNLEITVLNDTSDSSRNQAKQILKAFFGAHTPNSFVINHMASKSNLKYAIGTLVAGASSYQVSIFVSLKGGKFFIQQLKIVSITE